MPCFVGEGEEQNASLSRAERNLAIAVLALYEGGWIGASLFARSFGERSHVAIQHTATFFALIPVTVALSAAIYAARVLRKQQHVGLAAGVDLERASASGDVRSSAASSSSASERWSSRLSHDNHRAFHRASAVSMEIRDSVSSEAARALHEGFQDPAAAADREQPLDEEDVYVENDTQRAADYEKDRRRGAARRAARAAEARLESLNDVEAQYVSARDSQRGSLIGSLDGHNQRPQRESGTGQSSESLDFGRSSRTDFGRSSREVGRGSSSLTPRSSGTAGAPRRAYRNGDSAPGLLGALASYREDKYRRWSQNKAMRMSTDSMAAMRTSSMNAELDMELGQNGSERGSSGSHADAVQDLFQTLSPKQLAAIRDIIALGENIQRAAEVRAIVD